MSTLFSGALSGRFFSYRTRIEPGSDLRRMAASSAWKKIPDGAVPVKIQRGLCCSAAPHSGDLDQERELLGYQDRGAGLWCLWLREDERKVGKTALDNATVSLSLAAGVDLGRASPVTRSKYVEEARAVLLRRAIPTIRVTPIVLSADGWGWFGDRSGLDFDRISVIRPVCGQVLSDPLCWNPTGGYGWSSLSLAALRVILRNSSGTADPGSALSLCPEVDLVEVRASGRCIRCTATDDGHDRGRLLAMTSALVADPSMVVTQLTWSVHSEHEPVEICLDQHGVRAGWPPASAGGMPAERLSRRFCDLRQAAHLLGRELVAAAGSVIGTVSG
jgi:hypothetical protein